MSYEHQNTLDWYVAMAQDQATKAYAWERVKEMAREYPSVYGDLPARLTAAMQKAQQGPSQPAGGDNASAAGLSRSITQNTPKEAKA